MLEVKKLHTFKVKGGLGKHIVFSSLLNAIHKKFGKINIINSYPEVFSGNKNIQSNIYLGEYERNPKKFSNLISKIHSYDPYDNEFAFDDKHILDSWIEEFKLKKSLVKTPIVYIPNDVIEKTNEFIEKETSGKIILVQFSGGQSPIDFNDKKVYNRTDMNTKRNYPFQMSNILVKKLQKLYPEYTFINVNLPNEFNIENTKRIPLNFRAFFEVVKKADLIICIDSMLQHIAATSNTPTIVLWNSKSFTPKNKYGWEQHTNIQEPDMCIDYDVIIEKANDILKKKG